MLMLSRRKGVSGRKSGPRRKGVSRVKGEFRRRTSIFEGAFRAWSHLGGLEPKNLETKDALLLDSLSIPIKHDQRLKADHPEGSSTRGYPYEPLPRNGLSHPYVEAILSPWLGPDADDDKITSGLKTLRTWWHHRRKGASKTSVDELGTKEMKQVVETYTKHFFLLAHHFVVYENEMPPQTLQKKMKEFQVPDSDCINRRSCHKESSTCSLSVSSEDSDDTIPSDNERLPPIDTSNLTPIVFVSGNQDIQIALTVFGITSDHCVKIVESVLKGCDERKPPIDGLLDATADPHGVLIKIDKTGNAKRIAHEAMGKLNNVGYSAKVKELGTKTDMTWEAVSIAFEVVADTDRIFNWATTCKCGDYLAQRDECARHSQMGEEIFEAFDSRRKAVSKYMAECSPYHETEGWRPCENEDRRWEPIVAEATIQGFKKRKMDYELMDSNPLVDSYGSEGLNAPPPVVTFPSVFSCGAGPLPF